MYREIYLGITRYTEGSIYVLSAFLFNRRTDRISDQSTALRLMQSLQMQRMYDLDI